jgi:N-acetylneuraminic acid mutarotase
MRKLLIPFLFSIFLFACKDKDFSLFSKKTYDKPSFFGTFEGDLKGKFSSIDNNLTRVSVEKIEKNKISFRFYSKCATIETKIIADLTATNKFTIKEQIINNEKITGEGIFDGLNGIEISLNLKNISLKAVKISDDKEKVFEETKIEKYSPLYGFAGDEINIEGSNLDKNATIKFDGKIVEIVSFSKTNIKIKVPESVNESAEITYLEKNCLEKKLKDKFSFYKNAWKPIKDLEGTGRWYASGFSDGKNGIVGLGMDPGRNRLADLWKYDPVLNSWSAFSTFDGLPRNGAVTFTINNKIYIGTGFYTSGLDDFRAIDILTKEWSDVASIPNGKREHAVAFAANGKGYVIGGKELSGWKNDVWEYEPATNRWTKKGNIPGESRAFMTTMIFGDKILIGGGLNPDNTWSDKWYLYDPKTDVWTLKTSFFTNQPNGFVINGVGYCVYDDGQKFARYDLEKNEWRNLTIPKELTALHATIFQIGNKVYYGTGFNGQYSKKFWEYQP